MSFVDRELTCVDCNQTFIFTAGEQDFYEKKGFREEPKRCKPCRETRKQRRNERPVAPRGGGFEARGNGGGGFEARGNGGGSRGGHDEDDDNIGNRADTRGNGNGFGGGGGGRGARGGGGGGQREMFDATCAQCGAAARVPFKPAPGRPVYCRDCYASRGSSMGGTMGGNR
jgi:CxxC-x17-CxxC domain-containing protein